MQPMVEKTFFSLYRRSRLGQAWRVDVLAPSGRSPNPLSADENGTAKAPSERKPLKKLSPIEKYHQENSLVVFVFFLLRTQRRGWSYLYMFRLVYLFTSDERIGRNVAVVFDINGHFRVRCGEDKIAV